MSGFITAEDIYRAREKGLLIASIDALHDSAFIPSPVDWATENRYMPAEVTQQYGQFDPNTAPYLIEPLNCVDPESPITHIAMQKSVQSLVTTSFIENAIGYYIRYSLGSIMYLTSNKTVGKIRSSSAIDVLIDNAGIANRLKPISNRMKRKTADNMMYKEFQGGVKLIITSYRSIGDLKSNPVQLICCDEWDEAGAEIADQGDVAGIIEGRTMAARFFKILYVSTSSRMETSRIHKAYLEGDQRQYFVPCPICGRSQVLDLMGMGRDYGLAFNLMKDKKTGAKILDPTSVRYICQHCKGEFAESSKQEMLERGEWVPTWDQTEYSPRSPYHRSYHIPGLISPFLGWQRFCQQYINTGFGENVLLFKDFIINWMGRPWASQKKRAGWEEVYKRRDNYQPGEIPNGVLQMTMATDVHGDRLESLVVGWGRGGESWIIEKRVFYGDPSDPHDASWKELQYFSLTYEKIIRGKPCGLARAGIDQGYNPTDRRTLGRDKDYAKKPQIVQDFVANNPLFISVRGFPGQAEIIRPHNVQDSKLKIRYDVAVDLLKEDVFGRLDRIDGPGAIHFPDFEEENFRQFCSEAYKEVKPGKMGWAKTYERNEVLDMYIYNLALAYFLGIPQRINAVWDQFEQSLIDA